MTKTPKQDALRALRERGVGGIKREPKPKKEKRRGKQRGKQGNR